MIESPFKNPDSLWIFYFYRVNWPENYAFCKKKERSSTGSTALASLEGVPTCHYLLVFISINLVQQDRNTLKQDLIQMVEESLEQVAKKIKIRPELIIPLENLIKVEDLERLVKDKDQTIQNQDLTIQNQDQTIQNQDQTIQNQEQTIQNHDQIIQERDKMIRQLKDEIHNLKEHLVKTKD